MGALYSFWGLHDAAYEESLDGGEARNSGRNIKGGGEKRTIDTGTSEKDPVAAKG